MSLITNPSSLSRLGHGYLERNSLANTTLTPEHSAFTRLAPAPIPTAAAAAHSGKQHTYAPFVKLLESFARSNCIFRVTLALQSVQLEQKDC
jgi:hypothetical protein